MQGTEESIIQEKHNNKIELVQPWYVVKMETVNCNNGCIAHSVIEFQIKFIL